MAQLVVRNLDQDVKRRLQDLAKRRGQSMEEAVRDILRVATGIGTQVTEPLGTRIARRFANLGLTDGIDELRGQAARPAKFKD
jgi:plasmid stability protein